MKIKTIYLAFLITQFSNVLCAQVTIGSDEEPLTGALLDLKQKGATKAGLGLPRVELQAYDKLKMGSTALEHADKAAHIGLLVYNIEKDQCDTSIPTTGLYVWNGDRWDGLRVAEKHIPSPPEIMKSAIFHPNAYIVKRNTTKEIPIAKAYAVWESWPHYSGKGTMLPVTNFTENPEAEIVWQDKNGADFIINTISLDDPSKGREAKLLVTATGAEGNAVVGVRIDGEIRWSWHIWVTDVDIDDSQNQREFNGLTWMDRNLGAISSQPGDAGSIGLHYQWGRKDPFPTTKDWTNTETTVYLGADKTPSIVKNLLTRKTFVEVENLSMTIHYPLNFILDTNSPVDWYSISKDLRWNERWLKNEFTDALCPNFKFTITSVTNPCPEGWAVPPGGVAPDVTASPWGELDVIAPSNFNADKGWSWEDAGYYPSAGFRFGIVNYGDLSNIKERGCYWSALSDVGYTCSTAMSFTNLSFFHNDRNARTNGLSVRCVKE